MSSSASTRFLVPSPSQSPSGGTRRSRGAAAARSATTSGERESAVNFLPNFLARTRMRKRVGIEVVPRLMNSFSSLAGTVRRSSLVVPTSALTKTALPPVALEHDGVLVAAAQEVPAADLELLPDLHVHRRDARDDRRLGLLLLLGGSVGVDGGTRSRGDHEGAEGGHEGGAAQMRGECGRGKSSCAPIGGSRGRLRASADGGRRLARWRSARRSRFRSRPRDPRSARRRDPGT